MKTNQSYIGILLVFCAFLHFSCQTQTFDPLPSWSETPVKHQLLEYLTKTLPTIPVEDRIAVFDMDGTIATETPLWFEMAVAVQGMMDQVARDSTLLEKTEYQYAQRLSINPADTTVLNHWEVDGVNYLDSIILKAFEGEDYEAYIQYARHYLTTAPDPKYGMIQGDMFYQPMLELIDYLKANQCQVYIVSGSMQGVIWSICPQTIGLDRPHLIGTRQSLVPVYTPGQGTSFITQKNIDQPKNDGDGKTQNIYARIGKIPVMAFGNTTGDFGMFRLVSTSRHPHLALMINHDDSIREYAYPPYHGKAMDGWQDTLKTNGWIQADMAKEFKTLWKTAAKQPTGK